MSGKTIIKIGMFDPSSKTFHVCGFHKRDLTLKDGEWLCPECNTMHDRDINAAINIKKFAFNQNTPLGQRVEPVDLCLWTYFSREREEAGNWHSFNMR